MNEAGVLGKFVPEFGRIVVGVQKSFETLNPLGGIEELLMRGDDLVDLKLQTKRPAGGAGGKKGGKKGR